MTHTISPDIEPELRAPAPRAVRARLPAYLKQMALAEVPPALYELELYLRAAFISIPISFGLFFLYQLLTALYRHFENSNAQPPSSIYSLLPLFLITLVWNSFVLGGIREWLIKPLKYRWLVASGQPTIGRITGATIGTRSCTISYQFFPEKGISAIGRAEVPLKVWQELGGLNSKLTVLYAPGKDSWNIPYRCSGYEALAAKQG